MSTTSPTCTASILIPAFNAARWLAETLESALSQSVADVEVIVVDDGSTDSTEKVARAFGRRIRFERQQNAGASATRNRLTSLANGEYLQFLDADDLLPANALGARIGALRRDAADAAYSDWQRLEPDVTTGWRLGEIVARRLEDVDPDPAIALFSSFWAPPAAWTFRRTLIDRMPPWHPKLPIIQDARFAIDAALLGARLIHVPEVGAVYRCGVADSLSRRDPLRFLSDVYLSATEVRATVAARPGGIDFQWRRALVECFNYVARSAFFLDAELAERAWRDLVSLQPDRVPLWPRVAMATSRLIGRRAAVAVMRMIDSRRTTDSHR